MKTLRELIVEIAYKDKATPELDRVDKKVDEVKKSAKSLNKEITRLGNDFTKMGKKMTSTGQWLNKRVTLPLTVAAGASVKTFVDLEEAFAGVEKTVDGTEYQLQNIRKELDHMASNTIPVARKELYGIAENAGQLGIETHNITKFTDTIAKLGATTNLTYDSASSEIARFANITNMSMDNIERLGSTIVELGNNTSTTEAEIMSMAMRLGAAGKQVGMYQAEIIGLSAGLSSLGLSAEAGGTAVSKLLFDMQEATMTGNKQLGKYAKVAGMTSKEFKSAFETNAAGAVVAFTEGLGQLQKEGANVIGILNDMGLSEVRLRDAVLRVAGSNELLAETINMGNIAWEQNIALNDEFSKKAETNASSIQLFKSKVEGLSNEFGKHLIPHVNTGIDGLTKLIVAFGKLEEKDQKKVFNGILGLAAAGPALKIIGKITTGLGKLNTAVASAGGWAAYLKGGGAALTAFATGPVGGAILAVGALAAAIYGVKYALENLDSIHSSQMGNIKTMSEKSTGALGKNKNAGTGTRVSMSGGRNKSGSSASRRNRPGRNALGTNYWRGGDTELGERGMELVVGRQTRSLARGAKVLNHRDTEDIFNNTTSNSNMIQDTTFAPVINVTLTNGNKEEIEKVKDIVKREFDPLMEDFFYRFSKKLAMAD